MKCADVAWTAVGCPSNHWEQVVSNLTCAKPLGVRTMINVGANKGYRLLSFLQHFLSSAPPVRNWHALILAFANSVVRSDGTVGSGNLKWYACGHCGDCKQTSAAFVCSRHVQVHALELTRENRHLLRTLVKETKVPVHVWNFASSNVSGQVVMPKRPELYGMETFSMPLNQVPSRHKLVRDAEVVEVVTVDRFVASRGLSAVDHLAIDAEGWDALVVEGARHMLLQKRIRVLSFEYHDLGFWRREVSDHRTLRGLLDWLYEFGYLCFGEGQTSLFPISGECWRDSYEMRRWSNVVCSHDPNVLEALEGLTPARSSGPKSSS